MTQAPPAVRWLGRTEASDTIAAMRAFTEQRNSQTPDVIWLCEHAPVYTQGLAGQAAHLREAGDIPVVQTNRGGQVTYHGPGQLVAYPLLDLRRLGIYVKEYVYRLETAAIQTLAAWGVTGLRVAGAPGIYVRVAAPHAHAVPTGPASPSEPFAGLAKIAALGVKVSQHRSYHGLALNVAMDLRPFEGINPCGYQGLRTIDLATLGIPADVPAVAEVLGERLVALFSP